MKPIVFRFRIAAAVGVESLFKAIFIILFFFKLIRFININNTNIYIYFLFIILLLLLNRGPYSQVLDLEGRFYRLFVFNSLKVL
ncbi:hypothetical protein Desor_3128 [Desulfosporosinus orientis DSM 765]|uniref:Uncharacterized protein n=2 Tax=Desulfosporosinus orientis TaxID=1563 RepID=G7W6K4_DESOD|nr:hypothetical protein Desor_3128 [Desulfosporosinus orientis DSM 765]